MHSLSSLHAAMRKAKKLIFSQMPIYISCSIQKNFSVKRPECMGESGLPYSLGTVFAPEAIKRPSTL